MYYKPTQMYALNIINNNEALTFHNKYYCYTLKVSQYKVNYMFNKQMLEYANVLIRES